MALNAASVKKLAQVRPDLVRVVNRAAEITTQPFQIVQGNRTQAEQNALYAQGRTKKGPIVTWTKNSKHIGGNAIDFAALVNGKISWNEKLYPTIAKAFKQAAKELGIGIEWGGDWSKKDWGHIQLTGVNVAPKPAELKPVPPTELKPVPAKPLSVVRPILRQGANNDHVVTLQRGLKALGHYAGKIDGDYGPMTVAAVKAFQRAQGLASDGVMGPKSWAVLEALPVSTAKPESPPPPQTSPSWAVSFYESLGWSKVASAALVASLVWESGGNDKNPQNHKIVWDAEGDKDKGGVYRSRYAPQWNGPRIPAFEKFATARGKSFLDPETQLRFVHEELQTTEKRAAAALKAATTIEEANAAAITFWRPSIPHADKRLAIAKSLLKQ